MIKFIIKTQEKGWFRGLGLHHALIVAGLIAVFHWFGLGAWAGMFGVGMFFGREYKEYEIRNNRGFEILDFLSPLLVWIGYLLI